VLLVHVPIMCPGKPPYVRSVDSDVIEHALATLCIVGWTLQKHMLTGTVFQFVVPACVTCRIFSEDGRLVATCCQESLIRQKL